MAVVAIVVAACSSPQKHPLAPAPDAVAAPPRSGGYYKDDGPGDNPPSNLDTIPDAVPKLEPLSRFSNRPYSVFGVDYVPATTLRPYKERGIASWYGRKFHSQKPTTARSDM
jgi:rare lipoprotein A